MLREFTITVYLLVFRFVFISFKLFPQRRKTIFVTYFGYNALYTIEEIEKHTDEDIVVITNEHCHVRFEKKQNRTIIDLTQFRLYKWFSFVYHLATSDKVIVDNYYGFLAATNFKKGTTCIQVWHAAGAVKKFGLTDQSVKNRGNKALKRFQNVYNRFDKVAVGSEKMAEIFQESFGLPHNRMLPTGIPRTDFFFDEKKKEKTTQELYKQYPILKQKKVILYAPTFRFSQFKNPTIPFQIETLYKALHEDYVLLIKNHPLVKNEISNEYKDFVVEISEYENVNNLLLITDILISDYSSIPFEYAFLEKPMIFYPYDLERYTKKRGIWGNYHELVPGPVVRDTETLLQTIQNEDFDIERIREFNQKWNTYSDGKSSEKLVRYLFPHLFKQ